MNPLEVKVATHLLVKIQTFPRKNDYRQRAKPVMCDNKHQKSAFGHDNPRVSCKHRQAMQTDCLISLLL